MPPPPGSPLRLHCPVISAPVAHSPRSPQLGSLGPCFAVNTRVSSLQPCTLTQGQSRLRRQGSGTRGSDRAEGDRHLQPPSDCDARLLPQHPSLGAGPPRPTCPLRQGCWGCSHTPQFAVPGGPVSSPHGAGEAESWLCHGTSHCWCQPDPGQGVKVGRGRAAQRAPGGTQRRGRCGQGRDFHREIEPRPVTEVAEGRPWGAGATGRGCAVLASVPGCPRPRGPGSS